MGFKHEQFVKTVNEFLNCLICHEVLEQPQQCEEGHVFCKDCIKEWLKHNFTCPMDNIALKSDDLSHSLVAKNMIENLEVYCQPPRVDVVADDAEKCDWTGKLETLANHKEACPFQKVQCPNVNCNTNIQRRELEDHDEICDHKLIECDEQCGVTLIRRDLPNHKRDDCPEVRLSCPDGCAESTKRKNLDTHRETCPFQQLQCPNANCNIKMQRRGLDDHDEKCDHKLVDCDEQCGVTLIRRDLPKHKRKECPEVRVTCPNGCTEKRLLRPDVTSRIKRKDLHDHVTNTCKMRVVGCPFKDLGCSLQFAFQDLENHLQHSMSSHIMMLAAQNTLLQKKNGTLSEIVESFNSSLEAKTVLLDERRAHFQVKQEGEVLMLKRQLDELSEKCSSLERQCSFLTLKNTELEEELSKAKVDLSTYTWVIHDYHILTRKHSTGSCFKSPSFRLCGYKWYLILYPNGDGKKHEEFLSLHLCIADFNLPDVLRSGRVPTGEVPVKYGLRIMSRQCSNNVSYKVTMVFNKSATVSKHHKFMKTIETLSENYCDYLNNNRLVVKCTIHPAM